MDKDNGNTEVLINNLQNTIENYEKTNREQVEKITNLEEIISEMNEKLASLDILTNENSNLNYEINKQNEIISQKNKMISEFQELAKLSQIKFETFMNNNTENKNSLYKKSKKYSELKYKYLSLTKQYDNLEREYNKLETENKINNEKNLKEISDLNEKLLEITSKYNLIMSENEKLISENEQSKIKQNELNNKINNLNNMKEELENIKIEFNELGKELIEKNTKNELLEKFNDELKIKLSEAENIIKNNESYQKQLEEKIDNLNNICGKLENAFNGASQDLENKKIENDNLIKDNKEKNSQLENLKNDFNNQYKTLKRENIILKKRENKYKETLNQLKNYTDGNSQSINNNSYYTYNPTKVNDLNLSTFEKDESGKYSYFLIDNLRNTMSKIDINN